jgi:hypothetical protein
MQRGNAMPKVCDNCPLFSGEFVSCNLGYNIEFSKVDDVEFISNNCKLVSIVCEDQEMLAQEY